MNGLTYFLPPVICALIGWFTNYLAVKMLFHPRKPVRLAFFTLQGVFPKRQKALAESLGSMIEQELVSHEDIQRIAHDPRTVDSLKDMISDYLMEFFDKKIGSLSPMAAMFFNDAMQEKVRTMLSRELETMVPRLLEKTTGELEQRLNFRTMIQEKIENFSLDQLEQMLFRIMKNEFRYIELIGGILGLVIGIVQSVFLYFI